MIGIIGLGAVHKLRWPDFNFFWQPTLLHWHCLCYKRWQKVEFLDHLPTSSCEQPLVVSPAQKEYQFPSLKTLQPRKSPNNNSFHAKRRRKGNPLRWQLHDDQNSPTAAAAAAMLGCSSSSYTRAAAATGAHLVRTPLCSTVCGTWGMKYERRGVIENLLLSCLQGRGKV